MSKQCMDPHHEESFKHGENSNFCLVSDISDGTCTSPFITSQFTQITGWAVSILRCFQSESDRPHLNLA